MAYSHFYRTEAVDFAMKKYVYNKFGIFASFPILYVWKYETNTLCVQGFIQLPLFYRINWGRQYKPFKQNRELNKGCELLSSDCCFTGGKEKLIGYSFKSVLHPPWPSRYFKISNRMSDLLIGVQKEKKQ